jgi:tRNA G10  N-methylase Trm11
MINITGVKKGDVVLDPFCGFGTILQEALMLGMKPIGVDIDAKCVSATQKNLSWIKKTAGTPLQSDHVMMGDATHLGSLIPEQSVDAIVTEPILLPRLLRSPSVKKARSILATTESLYNTAIQEMAKTLKVTGKLALIAPFIVTSNGNRERLNLDRAFSDAGFRKFKIQGTHLTSPITMITKREFRISRELHFLEKA